MSDIQNKAGATIYGDITKHDVLDIPDVPTTDQNGKVYHVLSAGMHKSTIALVTIKENNQAVAYQLPQGLLQDWALNSIVMARQGLNAFPCDVEFGKLPTGYYAEML